MIDDYEKHLVDQQLKREAIAEAREWIERAESAETELARVRERQQDDERQLVWLANWCRKRFGIENNEVIGQPGWPNRLVEVVAKVVDDKFFPDERTESD